MSRDQGAVEVVPLALITFVIGSLVLAHAWGVMAARADASAAAREGARAFVEAPPGRALEAARSAALDRLGPPGGAGDPTVRPGATVSVAGRLRRCTPVSVRVGTVVPLIRLPWIGSVGAIPVVATHREVVDPYRSGLDGEASCAP